MIRLLLALTVAAAAEPSALFDGAAGRAVFPAAARSQPPASVPVVTRESEAVPPDLIAARARIGHEAMRSRLPGRAAGEPFTFGVLGDAEHGRFWWERVFSPGADAFPKLWAALAGRGPDFVLQLGDFVSEGDAAHYRDHVRMIEPMLSKPMFRAVGNHDRSRPNGDADKKFYDAIFGARDYFIDHGGWRFVALDSSDRRVTGAQLAWLESVLSVPGPKVVFTHVPPKYLKKHPPLKEVGPLQEGPEDDEKGGYWRDFVTNYFEEGSEEFERLILAGGVRSVYMGHIHAFWAGDRGGVRYVITGGGGSPLYPLPPGYPKKRFAHGLSVAAKADGGLTETVVPLEGESFVLPPVAR